MNTIIYSGAGRIAKDSESDDEKSVSNMVLHKSMKYDVIIMWFRRDLRIVDNTALEAAITSGATIIPIFIFTPTQINEKRNDYKSNKSVQFMIESLDDLNTEIKTVAKSSLFCFYGEPESLIPRIAKAFEADAVFLNLDYTPYSKKRDSAVEKAIKSIGKQFIPFHDVCLTIPGTITAGSSKAAYQKYTPFMNRVLAERKNFPSAVNKHHSINFLDSAEKSKMQSKSPAVKQLLSSQVSLKDAYTSYTIPSSETAVSGGRDFGLRILSSLKKFTKYATTRNMVATPTTNLSAYLKFGCLSIREVYEKIVSSLGPSHELIRQLIWRDFYIHLMDAYPQVIGGALKPAYNKIRWKRNEKWFSAWKEGRTGFPIVDAGMRQLAETGFMHNRARMITASFLIKTLLIDWREGERHFANMLVDYDPAANNGNWQWVAGTGADSQPYFRVFNPWLQSEKHDPDAEYIKRWVPELAGVEAKDIHRWHREDIRNKYKDIEYPDPIVIFEEQRDAVLEMYKSAFK